MLSPPIIRQRPIWSAAVLIWIFCIPCGCTKRDFRAVASKEEGSTSRGSKSSRSRSSFARNSDSDVLSKACMRLSRLGGGKRPPYIAVVATAIGEDAPWVSQLPLPSILYSLAANASVLGSSSANSDENSLGTLGVPAAAFLQYIIDYYDCLPAWALFLSGNGRTSFSGSTPPGRVAVDGSLRPGTGASHPLPPAVSSALMDVERLDAGFVAIGHYSADALAATARDFGSNSFGRRSSGGRDGRGDGSRGGLELHPAEIGFALHAPSGSHAMSFVSLEARRRGCRCDHFRLLLPGEPCERPWGWPRGGEFWASATRLRLRPLSFWRAELVALLRGTRPEHHDGASRPQQGDFTTMAASSSTGAGIMTAAAAGPGPVLHAHADDDAVAPFPNSQQQHNDQARSARIGTPSSFQDSAGRSGDLSSFGWSGMASSTMGSSTSRVGDGAIFQPLASSSDIAVHQNGKALTLRSHRNSAAAAALAKVAAEKKAHDMAELAARGACMDTLWHHLLGEPLHHYQPLYEYFEAMPLVPFATRCSDARQRLSAVCRKLKTPNIAHNYPLLLPANNSGASHNKDSHSHGSSSNIAAAALESATSGAAYGSVCTALHGDMLGEDVLVTPYLGSTVEAMDHSCCRKCREHPRCSFWVRATTSRDCWLRTNFVGYGSGTNFRGSFISEFTGIFLADETSFSASGAVAMLRPNNVAFNGFGVSGSSDNKNNLDEMDSSSSSTAEGAAERNARIEGQPQSYKQNSELVDSTSDTKVKNEQKKKKKAPAWKQWQMKEKSNHFLPG